ncbi:hypothetical protein NDR87_33320 [Nocardia sp. CDC159]|uniref:Uncharacterized protein n=1 Tax=Nocardia pulmonis TaxID=2951408 RepID=A0A9X2ED99_9NOCA|nr:MULTISPECIES: hypothetical protein [Nocardia]MCM6778339.1 hypothetical protein [Nocardia pulmonis]MCM6791265.1 hypothetical protein [Nocardia sp. CDC159]
MLSNWGTSFYEIGTDILAIGQAAIRLIADLIDLGGAGYGGGNTYPPGQYPLA